MRLRFVDVEVTEPQFFVDFTLAAKQLNPEVDVKVGERIVGVTEHLLTGGPMGSLVRVVARVWIAA